MLSYMLPVEEKSQSSRNLSLNLNLQNTSQSKACNEALDHDDYIDENTKLLNLERQNYPLLKINGNGNGNILSSGGTKTNYNMNITNNNLCNNLINSSAGQNLSTTKQVDSALNRVDVAETESLINEYNLNNNDDMSSGNDKKIIKMSKLGSKNVTLKR
jgi:hypothetical protein